MTRHESALPVLTVEATGTSLDSCELEGLLSETEGISIRTKSPHSSELNSGALDTLIISATSAGAFALRSILVEWIRSRQVSITICSGTSRMTYQGPIVDSVELARFTDGVATLESSSGS